MRLFLERHFEIIDQAVVLALALMVFVLSHVVDHDAFVLVLLGGNRIAIYAVIVGLFGTIFGFALTAMSIVLAFAESPRLRTLRESRHWATLWRVFTRGIRTFLLVALVGLVAIIVDRERRQHHSSRTLLRSSSCSVSRGSTASCGRLRTSSTS